MGMGMRMGMRMDDDVLGRGDGVAFHQAGVCHGHLRGVAGSHVQPLVREGRGRGRERGRGVSPFTHHVPRAFSPPTLTTSISSHTICLIVKIKCTNDALFYASQADSASRVVYLCI